MTALPLIIPLDDTGERNLIDRKGLAQWSRRSEISVRRHCKPVAVDPGTGRQLYEAEACYDLLMKVKPRRKQLVDGIPGTRGLDRKA